MITMISSGVNETEAFAERLAKTLKGNEVIAMYGGLGAGKTAFTRGLARGLGIDDGVSSPTFALVHEYEGAVRLFHFDMYRISTFDDLYSTGFFDYLGEGVIVIEWTENIEQFLPEERINIRLNVISDNQREIIVEGADSFENTCN